MTARRSLLHVDADSSAATQLAQELAQLSWRVEVAATLSEGRRLAGLCTFDALVVELGLPDGDGLELVQELAAGPRAPRVSLLLSGQTNVQSAVRAARAGVHEVLRKPIAASALGTRLLALLDDASAKDGQAPEAAATILGETLPIRAVRQHIEIVGGYPGVPVLVLGETGTGKELVAAALHRASGAQGKFLTLDAAAVPAERFEAELFGHEAGAHPGEPDARAGLLEQAQKGTVFLDELGEMPPELQPKLSRVLETRKFRRLGGQQDLPLLARVVGATQHQVALADSSLSRELYYQLAGFIIHLPALRERPEDIDELARHFATQLSTQYGVPEPQLSQRALLSLRAYDWPGNVRELRATIQQAAVASSGAIGVAELEGALLSRRTRLAPAVDPGVRPRSPSSVPRPLREVERDLIVEAWQRSGKNLSETARRLGLPRTTLRDKLKRLGVHGNEPATQKRAALSPRSSPGSGHTRPYD